MEHPPSANKSWPTIGAKYLGRAESAVLIMIGLALVLLALMMLGNAVINVIGVVKDNLHDPIKGHEHEFLLSGQAIEVLNSVLLVMMTMEIVYTVAISLEAHALVAEPFLIIGMIAAIRRMLVITATSTEDEHGNLEAFRNTLFELALLVMIVIAMAVAIYILRRSDQLKLAKEAAKPAPES